MLAGAALVWTECDIAVPPDQGFTAADGAIEVTCPKCLAIAP
jgi:hypothetical protein